MENQRDPAPQETPRAIETMDDLRAAMNSPEVQAMNREMSRRFLKNNRPKSLLVVFLAVAAVFLMLALSSHKASSVTPTALRTAETVSVSRDGGPAQPLTDAQRQALLDLLGQVKVERSTGAIDETVPEDSWTFTAGQETFTLTGSGWLLTDSNAYAVRSPETAEVAARLEALLSA